MGGDVIPTSRRTVIVFASLLTVGCLDGDALENQDPETQPGESLTDTPPGAITQMGNLTLTSTAFDDGERIPEQYGYSADNVNPPLTSDNVPEEAETLALIVDDPDAVEPAGKVWDHWVVWNIPPDTTTIPEDWSPQDATEGWNDYGDVGYGGPNPPDREHRYRFQLFALDTRLDRSVDTDADALRSAMEGHIIEQTQLTGTYPA